MAKKNVSFDITSMLNKVSMEEINQKRKKINYKKLIPHEKNHYSLDAIEELADSIESVGLLQDLVVKEYDNDNFKIVAGHRRHLAITLLVEKRGLVQFSDIYCHIIENQEDDVITQLKLHMTNTTARELTEHDKMIAVAETKRLVLEAKERGFNIKGKTRDIIGDALNLGSTQVQKYLNIQEQATLEVKEALKKGEITVQDAYNTTRPKKEKKPVQMKLDTLKIIPRSDSEVKDLESSVSEESFTDKNEILQPEKKSIFYLEDLESLQERLSIEINTSIDDVYTDGKNEGITMAIKLIDDMIKNNS